MVAEDQPSRIVFFDFDFTLTVIHVFKSLAGWVDAQVCMLPMRGMIVPEPHALSERGQLRRLSELGPAWIEQAFGGFSRVTAIRKLLDGLTQSGCRIILVTRGYVGVARKCLKEVGLLEPFEALYGNIGVAYGTRTAYDVETEMNGIGVSEEIDRLWSMLGKWKEGEWDSKTEIVHRYQHQEMLTRNQVLFVDDDSQELAPLRHSAMTVHAKGNGMGAADMLEILNLLSLGCAPWAEACYDFWHEEGQGDEVSVLRALAHPNLLRIFEVVKFPREVLIVTELAAGGTLSTYAEQHEEGPWISGAMQQILSAVAYCHRQFVLHGDLKPENVLIGGRRPDGSPLCIVCDFGHATVCLGSALVAAPGDPRYIPPEVIAKENLCTRSDVYMLGVTAFELLTGGWLPFFNLKSASLSMCYQQLSRGGVHERILSEKGLDWRDLERLRNACQSLQIPEVQDIVLSMMARQAADRPEAIEVLRTNWLQDAHGPCMSAYDAMLKADASNGWGLWVPQHPNFAKRLEERAGLSSTFRMLLSLLGSGLRSEWLLGARLLFRRMDEGGNGHLNKKQFCKAAVSAGLPLEVSEALFAAGDLHMQSYLDFKNVVMLFLDLEAFSTEELLGELRFLVARIRGPRRSESRGDVSPRSCWSSSSEIAFRLSDLQAMLRARPDARMELWVQDLQAGLGPGEHDFTPELLLRLLQQDCFDQSSKHS
ncbi:unnamed protein product [Effrenium voratum]|nr:unnamed protein product [Effrenium voratum]